MGANRQEKLDALQAELAAAKSIFEANASKVIDPDGSEEYWTAKKAFDGADRRIKAIEKDIAHILDPPKIRPPPSAPIPSPTMDDGLSPDGDDKVMYENKEAHEQASEMATPPEGSDSGGGFAPTSHDSVGSSNLPGGDTVIELPDGKKVKIKK